MMLPTKLDALAEAKAKRYRSQFNPYALENHYSMDMACYLVHRELPATVRVCTRDPEVIKAVVRRLAWAVDRLIVETPEVRSMVQGHFDIETDLPSSEVPDVALVPFARHLYETPPQSRVLSVIGHNALSYKSLLYPGQVRDNVLALMRWVNQEYDIFQRVGLFGPVSIFWWAISQGSGVHWAPTHFRSGQKALDHLFATGPLWWTGYITILLGRGRT